MNRKFIVLAAKFINKVERIMDEHKKIKAALIMGAAFAVSGMLGGKSFMEAASEGILLSGTGIAAIIFAA